MGALAYNLLHMTRTIVALICVLLLAVLALPAAQAAEPERKQGTYNNCLSDCQNNSNIFSCRDCCQEQAMGNGAYRARIYAFGNCWENVCNKNWDDGCVVQNCLPDKADAQATVIVSYNCHLKSY